MSNLKDFLAVFDEAVKSTLIATVSVVALESTIISHSVCLPTERKVETVLKVEADYPRQRSAIPATIAIING